MSAHAAFRRMPVQQQYAQNLRVINIPAPTRGIILDENEAFMRPGGAMVCDNWMPTMRGVKLRGGTLRYCDLHEGEGLPIPSASRRPVISAFEYVFGANQRMFAAQETKLFEVTTGGTPILVKSGQLSGNYAAAQMSNASGNYLTAVNDAGDFPLQFDGTTWTTLNADQINGPAGTPVEHGANLSYVCKYRGRIYFIEKGSMNVWYLGIDSIAGTLAKIPLSGSFARGGQLLFLADWSIDAGDGIDNKLVVATTEGEIAIFTGSNPADPNNWRQEGRYQLSPPMGMNAHFSMGGDLLILTTEGIIPLSQALTKTAEQLELAALTRSIKPLWREEVIAKREWAWSAKRWDEFGGMFVTTPGGTPGNRWCLAANHATVAWCRFVGWDATCFIRLRGDLFFGTQDGLIMQAERTGRDDGLPYVATIVGGWELFRSGAAQTVWHQARASFTSGSREPFQPQIDAAVDYLITIPPPPPIGPDIDPAEVWDQGEWDEARFDQPGVTRPPIRNTMWVSVGKTGFSHAPILQVTIAQQVAPNVELIAIAATSEPAGVNV